MSTYATTSMDAFSPIDTATALKRLRNDDRGAIMFLGVFVSLFLIGCLWFLIGVGDMVVFRDKAQEAADAASFTVTVVHAKGMNLIAALNMIMLAMAAIYMLLGMVRDVVYIVYVVQFWSCVASSWWGTGFFYCHWEVNSNMNQTHKLWVNYAKIYKKVAEALGTVQTVTAYVAPHLGQAAGINVGKKHKYNGDGFLAVSASASMIPGSSGSGGDEGAGVDAAKNVGSGFQLTGASGKLGLPVMKAKNSAACAAAADEMKANGGLTGAFGSLVRQLLVPRYCGKYATTANYVTGGSEATIVGQLGSCDTFWDCLEDWQNHETPAEWWEKTTTVKKMFTKTAGNGDDSKTSDIAENGTDWMQTYTFVMANFKDGNKSAHLVGLAGYDFKKQSSTSTHFYTAQSEMYYDCDSTWKDEKCNGPYEADDDVSLSLYALNWRARLVRVRQMNFGGVLGQFFVAKILNGGIFDSLGSIVKGSLGIGDMAQSQQQAGAAGKGMTGSFIDDLLGKAVDKGVDYLEKEVDGAIGGGGVPNLPALNNYH